MGTKNNDQDGWQFFLLYAVHTGNRQEETDTKKGVIIVSKKLLEMAKNDSWMKN